jgi:hypothetical protein
MTQTFATTKEDASTCVGTPVKLNFVITNTGLLNVGTNFRVSNFALSRTNALSFETTPVVEILPIGASKTITVLFAPMADIATSTIQLTYDTDILGKEKQSIDFTVEGYSFTGGSISSMHRVSANAFLDAAASIKVQDQVGYKITFNSTGAMAKAKVTYMDATITYPGKFLKAILDTKSMSDLNKYSLAIGKDYAGKFQIDPNSVSEVSNPTTQDHIISFKIVAIGANVFDGSGELVTLRFNSFLPSYTSTTAGEDLPRDANGKVVYKSEITHNLGDGNNLCFNFQARVPISITLDPVCASDIRPIVVGASGGYALQEVNPNPVTSAGGLIKFRVSTEGATELSIINSAGQSISVPVSSVMKEGEYEVAIPIQDLGSGTYNIVYRSGFFTDTKQLIIQK